MILPTLQQWAEELEGRCDIVKFNCNKANKELGVKVGAGHRPSGVGDMRRTRLEPGAAAAAGRAAWALAVAKESATLGEAMDAF